MYRERHTQLGVAELEPPSGNKLCGFATNDWDVHLQCPLGGYISKIDFASYGQPQGQCLGLQTTKCHSSSSTAVVQSKCLNQNSCTIPVSRFSWHTSNILIQE